MSIFLSYFKDKGGLLYKSKNMNLIDTDQDTELLICCSNKFEFVDFWEIHRYYDEHCLKPRYNHYFSFISESFPRIILRFVTHAKYRVLSTFRVNRAERDAIGKVQRNRFGQLAAVKPWCFLVEIKHRWRHI